jgi:YfiR/HmsC-like
MGILSLRRFALCALLAIVLGGGATAQTAPTPEYQLKAVFLFNFAQFVEWPRDAFASPDTPLSICVLGKDPFGSNLDEAVRGESAGGRRLVVERHAGAASVGSCHILFVPAAQSGEIDGLAARVKDNRTLLVTDGPQNGAMIGFVKERNRIRLRVNLSAVNAAQLTISSKLLRIAEIVGPRPEKR